MNNPIKIYLAGPEVFLPNAIEVLNHHKTLCKNFGFVGLSPLDPDLKKQNLSGLELANQIFQSNAQLIQNCDMVVANIHFFRGAVIDDGTAWEIGYAYALGKKIFGYLDSKIPLPEKSKHKIKTFYHPSGYLMDEEGYLLNEDFGNSVNLMIEFSIKGSGGEIVVGDFQACLQFISQKFQNEPSK